MKRPPAPGTLQFVKSLFAGGIATIIDLTTLTLLVEAFHFSPASANIPALIAGAATHFVGSRSFVFRATQGALTPQLVGFTLVELGTFALNATSFHFAVTHTALPYPLARILCQFAVYVGFSYPLWTKVFAAKPGASTPPPALPGTEPG
jgi:putative flippase GtrA